MKTKITGLAISLSLLLSSCGSQAQYQNAQRTPIPTNTTESAGVNPTFTPQPTIMIPTPTVVPINAQAIDTLVPIRPDNAAGIVQVANLWPVSDNKRQEVSGIAYYPGSNLVMLGTGLGRSVVKDGDLIFGVAAEYGMVMSEGTKIVAWDVRGNTALGEIETEARYDPNDGKNWKVFKNVAVSPDGQYVALAGSDRMLLGSLVAGSPAGSPKFTRQEIKFDDFNQDNADRGVVFSPESRYLAISAGNGDIRVWDMKTKQVAGTYVLPGVDKMGIRESGENSSLTFTPDGSTLLESWNYTDIIAWDLRSGASSVVKDNLPHLQVFALNPAGDTVVTGYYDRPIQVWKYPSWEPGPELNSYHPKTTHLTFSPDGRLLAASAEGGQVDLWDTKTWKLLTTLDAKVDFMTFASDSRYLVLGTYTDGGTLWGVPKTNLAANPGPKPTSEAFKLDDTSIVSGSFDPLNTEDASRLQHINQFWRNSPGMINFAVPSNGQGALANSYFFLDKTSSRQILALWNQQENTGTSLFSIKDPAVSIDGLAVSPDNQWVALNYKDHLILGSVAMDGPGGTPTFSSQELQTGELVVGDGNAYYNSLAVAFSHDSRLLAVLRNPGKILVWDLRESKPLTITTFCDESQVDWDGKSLYFTADDQALITACKGKLISMDLASNQVAPVAGVSGKVGRFTLNASGDVIATIEQSSIVVRNFPSGKQQARIAPGDLVITGLALNSDGSLLATSCDNGIFDLWDAQTGKHLTTRKSYNGMLSFTQDSRFLLTDGDLWGVRTGSNTIERSGAMMLHIDTGIKFSSFEDDFPNELLADEDGLPRYEIRLTGIYQEIQSCPYTGKNTLHRRRTGVTAKITDLQTSTLLGSKTFWGDNPDPCPDKRSFPLGNSEDYEYGPDPDSAPFITWIKAFMLH